MTIKICHCHMKLSDVLKYTVVSYHRLVAGWVAIILNKFKLFKVRYFRLKSGVCLEQDDWKKVND